MPAARYLKLDQSQIEKLRTHYRQTNEADLRTRCQMILLSAQGRSVAEIAQLTYFNQDSVLYWFDRYEQDGLEGLNERPRSGRPPKSN
ncbi:MAG: helix-turn-helix domain-containing protein [Chlorobiales bacterium]|nr:helix-turn-helix domain-containing protein [Chlorobiales bacterium]